MAFLCPECGTQVGEGAPEDGYLHLANCLHFAIGDPSRTLRAYEQRQLQEPDNGNAQRVYMGIQAYLKDRDSAVHQSAEETPQNPF